MKDVDTGINNGNGHRTGRGKGVQNFIGFRKVDIYIRGGATENRNVFYIVGIITGVVESPLCTVISQVVRNAAKGSGKIDLGSFDIFGII